MNLRRNRADTFESSFSLEGWMERTLGAEAGVATARGPATLRGRHSWVVRRRFPL